jgi:hypothetical protein
MKNKIGLGLSDQQQVEEFMKKLEHPLKQEMELVKSIILNANYKIQERVKWNAPSFFYLKDMAAFNPRDLKKIHLIFIFHNGKMIKESEGLLEGEYKDRRMAYFYSREDIMAKKPALEKVVNKWVNLIETD